MAAIFALTQFLQFALGYSALQAGATMVPLALGLMLSAINSSRLVARFGTKRVVAGGMLLLALTLSATVLWTPALSVWLVTSWLFVLGLAMGSVMAPATDAVMGSVPPAKAGVASAMNDVTRQVGGALGVAIVGSLISTIYTSRIGDAAAGLPAALRGPVEASIGGADAVAARLPAPAGAQLASAAADAFTTALGYGLLAAAAVAVIGAGIVAWRLPARHGGARGRGAAGIAGAAGIPGGGSGGVTKERESLPRGLRRARRGHGLHRPAPLPALVFSVARRREGGGRASPGPLPSALAGSVPRSRRVVPQTAPVSAAGAASAAVAVSSDPSSAASSMSHLLPARGRRYA